MSSRQSRPSFWIAVGAVLALVLRAPWLGAPLGRDEGGLALVAAAWDQGPFAYGDYFVDRPPLLVALFRMADGPVGVRVFGAIAAVGAVVIACLIARRLGGPRAVAGAAVVSAVLVSSTALGSVLTPAELLAIVPSAASVLVLLVALERPAGLRLFAAAGALAVVALLVKQSFGDALLAGAAALLALAWTRRPFLARSIAYGAGAAATILLLELWERLGHFADGSVSYAIVGFRLDALSTLSAGHIGAKLERLPLPALGSGLVVALVCTVAALHALRGQAVVRAVMLAWLAGGVAGIAMGGSYWAHYLVALAPVAAVGSGLLLARLARRQRLVLAAILVPAVAVSLVAIVLREPERYQRDAVTVADYLSDRARPGETAYVLYARANVLYYSGLQSPYPYEWSLMVRALPDARARLRALLASPRRPTWIVEWQEPSAFGLDSGGRIEHLLDSEYGERTTVCGHDVLLARGAPARPLPVEWRGCDAGFTAG